MALHAEGLIAHKTIKSLNRAAECAEQVGLSIELILVLDRATSETRNYVETSHVVNQATKLVSADFGDLGLTRNYGIQHSNGEYVAILDGDDLISESWLLRAHELSQLDRRYVVHPEVSVAFDQKALLMYHPDQRQKDFDEANIIVDNYWTALCFSRRETFLHIPYIALPKSSGFGYEDWYWNCEVMARGFIHTVALGTAHFIRAKEGGGLSGETAMRNALIPHSAVLENLGNGSRRKRHVVDAANNQEAVAKAANED
jgi:glycosyltransferase involved in cell wall biosynthesis